MHKTFVTTAALLLLANQALQAQIPLTTFQYGIEYIYNSKEKLGYMVADVGLGYNATSKKSYSTDLVPDLVVKETIVGTEALGFGVFYCKTETTDTCDKGAPNLNGNYRGTSFTYTEITTVAPMVPKFDVKQQEKLTIQWAQNLTKGETWQYGIAGVLGLGKGSNFLEYVNNQYKMVNAANPKTTNDFMFSILARVGAEFEGDRYLGNHTDIFDGTVLEFNGYQAAFTTDSVEKWLASSDQDFWTIDKLTIQVVPQGEATKKKTQLQEPFTLMDGAAAQPQPFAVTSGKACLDSTSAPLISLPRTISDDHYNALKKYIMNQVCGADTCQTLKSNVAAKGPFLQFSYTTVDGKPYTFNVKPYKYIYDNGGTLDIAIGDLSDLTDSNRCPDDANFALGRTFFAEKYLLFKIKNGAKNDKIYNIGFVDIVDVDDLTGFAFCKMACWVILGAMLVFFIITCICTAGRKSAEEPADMGDFKNMELE